MLRAALLAGFAAAAAAQVWGTTGSWQSIRPTTSTQGPQGWGARPVAVAGTVVWVGNDTATSLASCWAFDLYSRAWVKYPDLPLSVQPTQPFVLASGGLIAVMDEPNPNSFAVIDSASVSQAGAAWTTVTVSGAPLNRYGQRLIDWGGVLYSFGGFENSTAVPAGIQHNDLWALDMLSVVQRVSNVAWQQAAPDNSPGFPMARVGASFTAFNVAAVLFGGAFSSDPTDQDAYDVCFRQGPPQQSRCFLLSEVWLFFPKNNAPVSGGISSNQWIQDRSRPTAHNHHPPTHPRPNPAAHLPNAILKRWMVMQTSGANGGPQPSGRFQHSAGYMGDQLYIFGEHLL